MRRTLLVCFMFFSVFAYWEENWNYRNLYETEGGRQVFINFTQEPVLLTDFFGNPLNHSFGDGGLWGEGAQRIWVYYNGSGNQTGPIGFDFYSKYCKDCKGGNYSAPIIVSWYGKIDNRAGFDKASFVKINGEVYGESCREGECSKVLLSLDDTKNHSYKISIKDSVDFYKDDLLIYQKSGFIPENVSLNFSGNHYNITVRDARDKSWFVKNQSKRIGGFDVFEVEPLNTYVGSEVLCGNWVLVNLSGVCVINGTYESGTKLLSGCFEIYCYDNWTGLAFDKVGKRVVEESGKDFVVFGEGNYSFSNGTHFMDFHNSKGGWENFSLGGKNISVYVDVNPPEIEVFGPKTVVLYDDCKNISLGITAKDKYLFNQSENLTTTLCGSESFTFFAWDSVGNRGQVDYKIEAGNVSLKRYYSLPQQVWWITKNSSLPVKWFEHVVINFTGDFGTEVNFTALGKNQSIWVNKAGEYEEVFEFSNESIEVNLEYGDCFVYNFSKSFEKKVYLKAPLFNPMYHHTELPGIFNVTWFGVYSGNSSKVSICIIKGHQPGYTWCGDGLCTENCQVCPADCGRCGGGSGSLGGGVVTVVGKKEVNDSVFKKIAESESSSEIFEERVEVMGTNNTSTNITYSRGVIELKVNFWVLDVIGKLLKNPFNFLNKIFSW